MKPRERTVQQLYPLGALASRIITLSAAVAAPIYVVICSWLTRSEIRYPAFCLIALALVAAASLTVVISSSPLRAPLTERSAGFAYLWANLAMGFDALATYGSNSHIRDDYGPIVIGIIILSVAPYRPAREIATVGLISAIFAGGFAIVQLPSFVSPAPPAVFAIAAATPLLVLSLGAAAFVSVVVTGLERWRKQARISVSALDEHDSGWIARSVQQDRVTILNRDVVPFFVSVLRASVVEQVEIERAREISDAIRRVMVAEVDRGWLDLVIDQAVLAYDTGPVSSSTIVDDRRFVQRMTTDQRTAVRAFIVALFGHPSFTTEGFSVVVVPHGARCIVTFSAILDCPENQVRSELSPYFAVMRILFADLTVDLDQPNLTLQFSYDQ